MIKNLILIFVFILLGCTKDDHPDKNPPKTPSTKYYDLNGDSVNDIKIAYTWFTWDGVNSSGNMISGMIVPLNGNSILLKRDELTLFNKVNDTIRTDINEPYYWEMHTHPELVRIMNSSDDGHSWPQKWGIRSSITMSSYYLGIKINAPSQQIGWIQLNIDQSTGDIALLNKKFTANEFTIIGK
jgi:hypothetical protein